MPVHTVQQFADRDPVPFALPAREFDQNVAVSVIGNSLEKLCEMLARGLDQSQGWFDRSFVID